MPWLDERQDAASDKSPSDVHRVVRFAPEAHHGAAYLADRRGARGFVDILSQSKKLPAGLDKDKLESAKTGLASLNQTWTEASDAFKSGNLSDAIAKGNAAKAVEAMTALNMPCA